MKITKLMRLLFIAVAVVMVFSLFACTEAPEAEETTTEKIENNEESTGNVQNPDEPENTESSDVAGGETEPKETETTEVQTPETTESETVTETETEPACQHAELETIAAVAPTCEATGLTEGKKCAKCGTVTVAQETVAALGHAYDNGAVTTAPTCDGKGVKTFTCANDATHTYTEEIAAIGHAYDNGVVTTAPTCEGKGVKTFTCANDATHTYTEEIVALGHAYDNGVVTTAPTCEGEGVKTFTCANDASHTYTEPVAAKGHAFNGNWVLNEEKPGYFKDECANGCSAIQEKACEHEDITLGATVAAAPLTTSFTCKTCGITGATDKLNQYGGAMFGPDALKELADTQTSKKGYNYSATVMTDAEQNNLPFVRFELTEDVAANGEVFFYLVENGDAKIDLGGKVIFIIYRNGDKNTTGMFDSYASNGAGWPTDFTKTARQYYTIAQDGEWRAAVLNHSEKTGWTADGVQQFRIDIFAAGAAGMEAGAQLDIAFIGAFDTLDNAWAQYKSMLDVYKFEAANYQYSNGGVKINTQKETLTLTTHSPFLDSAVKTNQWYSADLTGKALNTKDNMQITPQFWWIVTPGGVKACNVKITDQANGSVLYDGEWRPATDASETVFNATSGNMYGSDRHVGGTTSIGHIKLNSYSGKTITVELYVVTNFGQTIKLLVLTNCAIG